MAEDNLWEQLQRAYRGSRLVQYLLPVIPAILCAYLALVVSDSSAAREREYRQLQEQFAKLARLTSDGDWETLLQREHERQEQLRPLIWSARSIELGRADLQTSLNALLRDRLDGLRISFAEPRWLERGALWSIPVEVRGRLDKADGLSLFVALSNHRPRLTVDQLDYSPQRSGLISIQLLALLDISAAEPVADDQAAEADNE